jgi:hypothetical protein
MWFAIPCHRVPLLGFWQKQRGARMGMTTGVRASAAVGQAGVGNLSLPHCDVGRLVERAWPKVRRRDGLAAVADQPIGGKQRAGGRGKWPRGPPRPAA